MNKLLTTALILGFATNAFADIQDPPSNNYGPTRKLGRGISNMIFGIAELPVTIARINEREGNSAAAGGTYYPILQPPIPYIHAGYEEFPPELGNESKYPYVRMY